MRAWALLLVLGAACATTEKSAEPVPVERVAVEGNENVSRRDLLASARRELKSFAEYDRREADAADAAYSMELLLRERGFAHGKVTYVLDEEQLLFRVDEGQLTYFGTVSYEGLESFPRAQLDVFFQFRGGSAFGSGDPLYRKSDVDAAVSEVERFFLLNGFYRVEIDEPAVTWNEERTRADVTVTIREGREYTIARVEFEGIEPMDVGLSGQPFHVRLPLEAAARVRRKLLDEGRQRVSVRSSSRIDDERAEAVVVIRVQPGPKVRLRDVEFTGQQRTKERFLRRRIPIEEGELVLQRLLDRGIDNLYRSGLFSLVRSEVLRVGEDQGDLAIQLEELPAKSVDLELGYGSYELARGAVRFRDRNIFGIGRRFSAEARGSVRGYGLDLGFEEPYLLGEHTTLEFGAGYEQRAEPSFDLETASFDVTATRRFEDSPYRLRMGYGIRLEKADNAPEDEDFGTTRTAGVFARLQRDTRDSILIPTRGSVSEFSMAWSSPTLGADLDFLEVGLEASQYLSLGERTVLGVGFRFRTREILDDAPDLPIQERLFLGGESDVRSFDESELGPVSTAADSFGEPRGGLTSSYASIELRRQLRKQFHGALFYDVGNVARSAFSWEGPAGHAIGFGLRYYFPVGPLRVDFGWNPGRRFAMDRDWAIHFAFGFSF
jgi:outer membrane protein assembly complex protein YaeT